MEKNISFKNLQSSELINTFVKMESENKTEFDNLMTENQLWKNMYSLKNKPEEFSYFTCAAYSGLLDCLQHMHSKNEIIDKSSEDATHACMYAAQNGQLECLKFLHENGYSWNEFTCARAAQYGHLDCLKYAYENGCVWDTMTITFAANFGHLDCLKYAYENKCNYAKHVLMSMSRTQKECFDYIKEYVEPTGDADICNTIEYDIHYYDKIYGNNGSNNDTDELSDIDADNTDDFNDYSD